MSSVSSLNSLLSSSTTSSTSSSLNLSSLLSAATGSTSTGIDVSSAVSAAIYAAQAPERQWQTEQATVKSQISALTSIKTALATLSTDTNNLNSLSGSLAARTVTSSSPFVTATATSGTALGAHVVSVSALASTASWYSPALASSSASLGTTQLRIVAHDGTTTSIQTGSGVNSLSDLASAINGKSLGITASVVTDSTGSRLAMVGTASGASNDFSVSLGPTTSVSWSSGSVASSATALPAGSFDVSDGVQSSSISVAAGDTLSAVATKVNNAGLNVTASVVTDSAGAHLSITPTSGTAQITGDPTFTLTRASQGADASLTVDGIPVTSATNTVTGVVSGLTLNLLGTTAGSQASLSVAADASQISGAVSQFVTDYNAALSLVNTQFTYSSTSSSQGVLSGDATVRSLQSALMSITGYTGAASSSGSSSTPSTLASLGITVGDDGSLSLNTQTLNQAITSNASAVQNFFQGTALNGFAQTFSKSLKTFTNASNGALTVDINNLTQSYSSLQTEVDEYESGYIASQRTVLTAMYSKAEIALQSLPATLKQIQAELGSNSGN